jgi:hypothetical protein
LRHAVFHCLDGGRDRREGEHARKRWRVLRVMVQLYGQPSVVIVRLGLRSGLSDHMPRTWDGPGEKTFDNEK